MADNFKQWCYEAHANTNHLYYDYIPYRFHLEMVNNLVIKYKHVSEKLGIVFHVVEAAGCGHDLMEDTRKTYNDVFRELCRYMHSDSAHDAADIIFAVTNNTGKTRAERANADYYNKIRLTHGAILIKLCDRIANVTFGKLMGGRMWKMYQEENEQFLHHLFTSEDGPTEHDDVLRATHYELIGDLNNLFI